MYQPAPSFLKLLQQLDIPTPTQKASAKQRLTLLGLPYEVRENIYSFLIYTEQENDLEYVGKYFDNAPDGELCTPVDNIRPPSLVRVCRTLRQEYLPYYFRETIFRVYVDISANIRLPGHPALTEWCGLIDLIIVERGYSTLKGSTRHWIDSLKGAQETPLRNIQFRLLYNDDRRLGANFNVRFDARSQRYQCSFTIDNGWHVDRRIEWSPRRTSAIGMPQLVWDLLKCYNQECSGEILDWYCVQFLMLGFMENFFDANVDINEVARKSLVEWSGESDPVS